MWTIIYNLTPVLNKNEFIIISGNVIHFMMLAHARDFLYTDHRTNMVLNKLDLEHVLL